MSSHETKIRLYVTEQFEIGGSVSLSQNQIHYLRNVMRMSVGDKVSVFNGRDGEWVCEISILDKKKGEAHLTEQIKDQVQCLDIQLVFAPIKKTRLDFLIEKSTELGVGRLTPVQTERTQNTRLKEDRLQAQMIEAAEQCERLDVPVLDDMAMLGHVLENWPADRVLFVCAERGRAEPIKSAFSAWLKEAQGDGTGVGRHYAASFLVGPEGGFSNQEWDMLQGFSFVKMVSMGDRILRAETAACSVLSCYQAMCGDWGLDRS